MKKFTNLTGQTFHRLTAVSFAYRGKSRASYWFWRCECGVEKVIAAPHVKSGRTKSCGCWVREIRYTNTRTHGGTAKGSRIPEYIVWQGMIRRCTNPNNKWYARYGGRGITVCERWLHSFENFLADMGKRPEGLTLERVNNNKGYSPDNCKWASRREQLRNTQNTRLFTHNGQTMCVADWAEQSGMSRYTLYSRLNRGMTIENALSTPIQPTGR